MEYCFIPIIIKILQTRWCHNSSPPIFHAFNFSFFVSVVPNRENRLRARQPTHLFLNFYNKSHKLFSVLEVDARKWNAKVWKFARENTAPHRKHLIFDSAGISSHFTHFFAIMFIVFHPARFPLSAAIALSFSRFKYEIVILVSESFVCVCSCLCDHGAQLSPSSSYNKTMGTSFQLPFSHIVFVRRSTETTTVWH